MSNSQNLEKTSELCLTSSNFLLERDLVFMDVD